MPWDPPVYEAALRNNDTKTVTRLDALAAINTAAQAIGGGHPRPVLLALANLGADPAASIQGGSWEPNLPGSNLLDIRPQLVAQATGTSVSFSLDLGGSREVGLVHLQNLITDPNAAITVSVGGYTATSTAWPIDSNGLYDPIEFAALGRPRVFVPPTPVTADNVTISIDGSTAPLQIGLVGAYQMWTPPSNFNYGWKMTYLDESDIQRVPFGSTYVVRRGRRRRLNFGIDWIPDFRTSGGPDYSIIPRQLFTAVGMSVPVIVVPFPDDTDNLERNTVWGLFSTAPEISNPFFSTYATTLQIDELI